MDNSKQNDRQSDDKKTTEPDRFDPWEAEFSRDFPQNDRDFEF